MAPNNFVQELQAVLGLDARIPFEPCDSPIEDIFLEEFRKIASDEVRVETQHECQTRQGEYRIDFVLTHIGSGRKVGIECDGREFHQAERDSKRDAAIVAAGVVDTVFRLRGRDLTFRVHDTLHLLSKIEPWLLSIRGKTMLETHCRPLNLRKDSIGPSERFFTDVAFREYQHIPEGEYDGWEDAREDRPMFPTIIYWTKAAA